MVITNKALIFSVTLITALIISHQAATAQNKWKDGYVVTQAGDTVHGEIAFKDKPKPPKTLVFRNKKGDEKHYRPFEVRSFTVHLSGQDVYFKSFSSELDVSPTDLASIDNSPNPTLKKCEFFAQLLVAGKKSLYVCLDSVVGKKHYLIEAQDGALTELINKHYYLDMSRTTALYSEEYKRQLGKLYSDCHIAAIKKIEDAQYSLPSLMHLARDYNKCDKRAEGYEYKREKAKTVFGVDLGAGKTALDVNGSGYNGITFAPSYSFVAGIFLNCILPHTERRWSICNELLYAGYSMKSDTYYPNYPYTGVTAKANLDISYLKLFTSLRYQYSKYAIRPFAHLGITNGYSISSQATALYHQGGLADQTGPFIPFRKYEQSWFGGAGISYKKYEAEIRYERGNGFSNIPQSVSTSAIYLLFLVKYSFK